jgi:putative ATP-dependent endonuclease of the OLD family
MLTISAGAAQVITGLVSQTEVPDGSGLRMTARTVPGEPTAVEVALVEGPTEALALPALLRTWGLDVLQEGIAVVPVHGIGNIAKWHRLYTALGITCFCVFDTDSDKGEKDAKDLLAKRKDIMTALGLDPANAEAAKLSQQPLAVDNGFATLNPNFEGAMAALFGAQSADLCEAALPLVGESKPLQARYAAARLERVAIQAPEGAALDALARAIRGDDLILLA